MSENEDYRKFLEASGYIQQFTANLLRRNEAKPPEISGNLSNINQLIDLVKQLIQEQRNLTQKVDAVNSGQRNINSLIKEKLGDPNLPSTSSAFPSSYRLNQQLDSDLQQNFNLELILGQIKSSTTSSAHFDHYENVNNYSNFFDSSSLDSSPNSKKNGAGKCKKRQIDTQFSHLGPYHFRI
ncbi:Protein CBR-ZTF-3 [Caenorhabditis briggsae]|uniref:Protein CBR-ZTF-3 n=1 Tax=Caenorhabditis briggsae TaxID=6238 RepID=A8Y1G7_CAEBR|nr:Protein CBR-ZTF-3 [Caenorhabditis briggsae]CAP38736.2 Protein CBR-ZTF-3 [Caenorhabditis briggsae]